VKYAILADIHRDRKRLKQVLQVISTRQVDHVCCLGDIFECRKKRIPSPFIAIGTN
jgi:predicted phosphodiesterase